MPFSWLNHPSMNQALALGFSALDAELALISLIITAVCVWLFRRKKLGRITRRRLRNELIAWGVLPRQEIDYSKDDTTEYAQAQAVQEQRKMELMLAWGRLTTQTGLWMAGGSAAGSLLGLLLIGYALTLPAAESSNLSSAYSEVLVLLWAAPLALGLFIGVALSIITRAGHDAPPRTLDDYRSPHIRWVFLAHALITLLLVIWLAHGVFTLSPLSAWLLAGEYLLAGGVWLVAERLGAFVVRWPREQLSRDPELATVAAEKARAYAVTTLLNLQYLTVWLIPYEALWLISLAPGGFSSLTTGIFFLYIFVSSGGLLILNIAHGKLGGRLTGWPGLATIRDPWKVDEILE